MPGKVSFNGVDYDGVDAMPAEIRQEYEKVLGLLSPEDRARLEEREAGSSSLKLSLNVHTRIKIGGKAYDSVDQMPPAVRAAYDRALGGKGAVPGPSITPGTPMLQSRDDGDQPDRRRQLFVAFAFAILLAAAVLVLRAR
ncbi:MAG TPA: hypothetical protein VGR60_00215 [Gemmatimonadales bacterium]|nr:hypothetical protein [Gemmatimonadales bacterium]